MDVSVVDPRSALTMELVTGTSILSGVVTEIVVDTYHFPFEEVNVLPDMMQDASGWEEKVPPLMNLVLFWLYTEIVPPLMELYVPLLMVMCTLPVVELF